MLQSIGHKDSDTTEQLNNNICYLQIAQFYLFSSNLDTLYSFYCLIAEVSSSNIMLNTTGKTGHPCLVPKFSKKAFNFSAIDYYIGCGFAVNCFHYVEICFLYTHLGESFYYE